MDFEEYQRLAARTWGKASDVATQEDGSRNNKRAFQAFIRHTEKMGLDEESVAKIVEMGRRLDISALANGLTGEAGEVADEIKKYAGHGHWKDGVDIEKELGDVLWYIAAICKCLGLSMDKIAEANIAKLQKRYSKGFSTQGSIERADLSEG